MDLYNKNVKSYTEIAQNVARQAAKVVDPDRVEAYISQGQRAPGNMETKDRLVQVSVNVPGA